MAEVTGPRGGLAKYGERLIRNGYKIIPIRRGGKAPRGNDWQKLNTTLKTLPALLAAGPKDGVGILTRDTPGVDIDILDPVIADKLERFVQARFGLAPVRYGMAPKRLLLFQSSGPFTKINSAVYEDEWGDPTLSSSGSGKPTGHLRKVEILGDGQQFVAYAIHPDTGKPYRWEAGDSPILTPAKDLPFLTEADGREIVEEFDRLAFEAGWTVHKDGQALARRENTGGRPVGRIDDDDVFASDVSTVDDLSEDEIHARLLLVPGNEDYETWLQIGMALFHQFGGSDRGLELWHEWSESASNYEALALDEKWPTFEVEGKNRAPVTARLILKLSAEAQEKLAVETFREVTAELRQAADLLSLKVICDKIKHLEFDMLHRTQIVNIVQKKFKEIAGSLLTISIARDMVRYENPTARELPHWLEGWVYITQSAGYFSTTRKFGMGAEAFSAAHSRFMLTKQDVLEGKSVPETPAAAYALNNMQIPVVQLPMYLPGEDPIFSFNSKKCVNTYSDLNIPEPPDKLSKAERAAIATVEAHVVHLFDNVNDREVLIDAMAFLVQNTGKRINWGILLQGAEGDGKSFFAGLLGAVLGSDNVKNLHAQAMEEKYNGWSEGAQVVFFEEIKLHGHNRFDVLNKVKPLLTNPTVPIRRMQTDIYDVVNTVTYFLTTNFKDALPINDNDSRYFMLFSRWQTKEDVAKFEAKNPTYYDDLFATLEHDGALRKWLLERKISPTFSAKKRAPMSAAKKEMVGYSRSAEETLFREILAEGGPDLNRHILNSNTLATVISDRGGDVPYGRAMNGLLLSQGFTQLGRVKVGKEPGMFWSRTPEKFRLENGKPDAAKIRRFLKDDL